MTLTVCLMASEAAPLSKTGGLADVSSALTKYLHAAGPDARLGCIHLPARLPRPLLARNAVHRGSRRAPAVSRLHPRGVRVLSANAMVTPDPPLQRLAY